MLFLGNAFSDRRSHRPQTRPHHGPHHPTQPSKTCRCQIERWRLYVCAFVDVFLNNSCTLSQATTKWCGLPASLSHFDFNICMVGHDADVVGIFVQGDVHDLIVAHRTGQQTRRHRTIDVLLNRAPKWTRTVPADVSNQRMMHGVVSVGSLQWQCHNTNNQPMTTPFPQLHQTRSSLDCGNRLHGISIRTVGRSPPLLTTPSLPWLRPSRYCAPFVGALPDRPTGAPQSAAWRRARDGRTCKLCRHG